MEEICSTGTEAKVAEKGGSVEVYMRGKGVIGVSKLGSEYRCQGGSCGWPCICVEEWGRAMVLASSFVPEGVFLGFLPTPPSPGHDLR